MKVLSVFLVLSLLVTASWGCSCKDLCCDDCCGYNIGCGLQDGCGYGCGYGYGYSNPYGVSYNQYNPYGSAGYGYGCGYECNPYMACLMKKIKPCLLKKAILMKKMYKKNLIARKCLCSW